MSKRTMKLIAMVMLILLGVFVATILINASQTTAYAGNSGGNPAVRATILSVDCTSVTNYSTTFTKLGDFGTIDVSSPNSLLEITFEGRIGASIILGNGVVFELRVDDAASTNGRSRTVLKDSEGGGPGLPVTFSGVFSDLPSGPHTVSIWVLGLVGGGSGASVDSGCWGTDKIVVKEYTPFGSAFLPAVTR